MHPIRSIKKFLGMNGMYSNVSDVGPLSFFSQWFNPNNMVGELEQLEQYKGVVYTCVTTIAREVAKIEWNLNKVRADGTLMPVKGEHPFLKMIKHPNPSQSDFEFVEMTQTHMDLAGEAFWYVPKGQISGKPKELWLMRPDLVQIVYNTEDGEVSGYVYHKWNGRVQVPLDLEEVIHFKMPNPINPYRGMSPVQAGIVYIQTEEYASQYSRNFLANGGTPSGIVNFKGTIPDPEFQKIKRQWQREYGGVANGGKTAFMRNADASYTKVGSNFSDIDLKELKNLTRDDIMMMYGISRTNLGIQEDVPYANAKTAQYTLAVNVIDPRMYRLTNILQRFYEMRYNDGLILGYTSPIPQDNQEKIDYLNAAVGGPTVPWMTVNEARAEEGLAPMPGGDVLLVPFNLVPLIDDSSDPNSRKQGSGDSKNGGGDGGASDNGDKAPDNSDSSQNEEDAGSGSGGGGNGDNADADTGVGDGSNGGTKSIRKKAKTAYGAEIPEGNTSCDCCAGKGEHFETGFECYRCDASGYVNEEESEQLIPCAGREDSPEVWVDDKGNYRHAEEKKAVRRVIKRIVLKKKAKADHVPTLRDVSKESFRFQLMKTADMYIPQIKDRVDHVIAGEKQKMIHQLKNIRKRDLSDELDYNDDDTKQELIDQLTPVLGELMVQAGKQGMNLAGSDVPYGMSADSEKRITERIARVAADYSAELKAQIVKAIKDGLAEGKTLADITRAIEDTYTQWQGWRAERLARTEAVHEANYAALDAYLQSSVVIKKEWYANSDACEYCLAMNGQVMGLEDAFVAKGATVQGVDGGTFLNSYDDVEAGDLHPNCRCTILPVVGNND